MSDGDRIVRAVQESLVVRGAECMLRGHHRWRVLTDEVDWPVGAYCADCGADSRLVVE